MNGKKAKKLRKVARTLATMIPNTTTEKEYKKLKEIDKSIKRK
jgi:hypothetical protein